MSFEESPVSGKIFNYFNTRIGQYIAPIGLLKALAIHSAGSAFPRLSVLHEARSREWKTKTTELAMQMFDKEMYLHIEGEKTLHGIKRDFGTDFDGKCIILNDGNLLFKSLSKRGRERWLSGISVLMTEKRYEYTDNVQSFILTGKISVLINIVTRAFTRHKNEIFETTLGDRMMIVHPWMKEAYNIQCKRNFDASKGLKPKVLITEHNTRAIQNYKEYEKELLAYAKDYAILSVRSTPECMDIVKAIVRENARINDRNWIDEDDIMLVRILRKYLIDPDVPNEHMVVGFLKEGRNYKDICHLLGKPSSYYSTITYYKKQALQKGALDAS